jgi:hypothetical protein
MLSDYYTNVPKIRKLISLGDISILAPEIGRKTDFDNPKNGQVIAYGRDRGEKDIDARRYQSYDEYVETIRNDTWIEYLYVFDVKDRKWYFTTHDKYLELINLKEELNK